MPVKPRESNIELLRVICMFMIVAYHLISNGLLKLNGANDYTVWADGNILNKITSAFFFPGGATGNMLFFMITGYFLAEKEFHSGKSVITETILYSVVFSLLFLILKVFTRIPLYTYGGGVSIYFKILFTTTRKFC